MTDPVLGLAVRSLKARPDFLAHCQEALAATRRAWLVQRFVRALTVGGEDRRPIELQAHDPARYVGDMLAWVHQTMAAEKDFLVSVFGKPGKAGDDADGSGNNEGAGAGDHKEHKCAVQPRSGRCARSARRAACCGRGRPPRAPAPRPAAPPGQRAV